MSLKSLNVKKDAEIQSATVLGPGDFPIGSPESRAAARLRLQGIGGMEKGSPVCICFPEDEQPFFGRGEERIAASVKCPLHGERFKPTAFDVYVSEWRRKKEPLRRTTAKSPVSEGMGRQLPPPDS